MSELLVAMLLNWQVVLQQWQDGQPVEPTPVIVRVTWYDPMLGGTNCNGDCEHLGPSANGVRASEWYWQAAACPEEIPRGTEFTFTPRGWNDPLSVTCKDGGEAIVVEDDGAIRIDVLTRGPIVTGNYPALMALPDHTLLCPTGPGCEAPIFVPYRVTTPLYREIPLPQAHCPVGSCDPWQVKIAGLGGALPGEEHWGVDLWTGEGGAVRAPWDATVVHAGPYALYGGMVALDYGNGYWTRAGHLEPAVELWDTVKAGQIIGYVDDSGYTLDGQHVHFELWWGWTPYDVLEVIEAVDCPPLSLTLCENE